MSDDIDRLRRRCEQDIEECEYWTPSAALELVNAIATERARAERAAADAAGWMKRTLEAEKDAGQVRKFWREHDLEITRLRALADAARAYDKAVRAQERFECNHYEPPCKCGIGRYW